MNAKCLQSFKDQSARQIKLLSPEINNSFWTAETSPQ